jgi:hypothetical protein
MRNWGQMAPIRAARNRSLGGQVLVREILLVHLVNVVEWVRWQVGFYTFSTKPRYLPLRSQVTRPMPLSFATVIDLFYWSTSPMLFPPRSDHNSPSTCANSMLQSTKTRSLSTRQLGSTSRLGLGGHLPNPAYLGDLSSRDGRGHVFPHQKPGRGKNENYVKIQDVGSHQGDYIDS